MRSYTVKELDRLRAVINNKYLFGHYDPNRNRGGWSRSYNEKEQTIAVEEMVHTHMQAGHTADDLIASEKSTDVGAAVVAAFNDRDGTLVVGGTVPGPDREDSTPVVLAKGSYEIPEAAIKKYGRKLLDKITGSK